MTGKKQDVAGGSNIGSVGGEVTQEVAREVTVNDREVTVNDREVTREVSGGSTRRNEKGN